MKRRRWMARQVFAAALLGAVVAAVLSLALLAYWLTDGFRDYIVWCDRFHAPLAAWAGQHQGDYPERLSALPSPPYQPRYQLADCRYERLENGYRMVVLHGFGVSFYESTRGEWVHD